MKKLVGTVCLALGIAFASGCAEAPEVVETQQEPLNSATSASFSKMLQPYGLDRLDINAESNTVRILYAKGPTVTLTSKTLKDGRELIVAAASDGSRATMYMHESAWPVISTRRGQKRESHILFHQAASVHDELDYWKNVSSAALALVGLTVDTMAGLYNATTESELTARLEQRAAFPGIPNASFSGSGSGRVRPAQLAGGLPPPEGDDDGDLDIPPPLTDAELQTIEVKKDIATFTRDCIGPAMAMIFAALGTYWSCKLCITMIGVTLASAAGGPVAIITILGMGAACSLCLITGIATIRSAIDTYNGCINGQENNVLNPPGGGGGGGFPGPQVDIASF